MNRPAWRNKCHSAVQAFENERAAAAKLKR